MANGKGWLGRRWAAGRLQLSQPPASLLREETPFSHAPLLLGISSTLTSSPPPAKDQRRSCAGVIVHPIFLRRSSMLISVDLDFGSARKGFVIVVFPGGKKVASDITRKSIFVSIIFSELHKTEGLVGAQRRRMKGSPLGHALRWCWGKGVSGAAWGLPGRLA